MEISSHHQRQSHLKNHSSVSHLEYFHHHSVIAVDVDGFEHFAIFASTELPDQLVIILVAERRGEKWEYTGYFIFIFLVRGLQV